MITTGRDSISVGVVPPYLFSTLTICFSCSFMILSLSSSDMDIWPLINFLWKKYRYHSYSIFSQEDSNPFKKNLKIWCYYTNNQFGTEGRFWVHMYLLDNLILSFPDLLLLGFLLLFPLLPVLFRLGKFFLQQGAHLLTSHIMVCYSLNFEYSTFYSLYTTNLKTISQVAT